MLIYIRQTEPRHAKQKSWVTQRRELWLYRTTGGMNWRVMDCRSLHCIKKRLITLTLFPPPDRPPSPPLQLSSFHSFLVFAYSSLPFLTPSSCHSLPFFVPHWFPSFVFLQPFLARLAPHPNPSFVSFALRSFWLSYLLTLSRFFGGSFAFPFLLFFLSFRLTALLVCFN